MMLTEVLPEALPDAQAVKGFFDSLTSACFCVCSTGPWSVPGWSGPPTPCSGP